MDNPNDFTVLDEVAGLTAGNVPNFDTLRARYETDPRLRVDGSLMSYVNGGMVEVAVAWTRPVHLDSEDSPSGGGVFGSQ